MQYYLITEENLDQFTKNSEFPNLVTYPIKMIREDFYDVGRIETLVFWGLLEASSIRSKNVTLKSIGKFDGSLEEALDVLKVSLPPSQVMLIHTQGDAIYRTIVPRRRSR